MSFSLNEFAHLYVPLEDIKSATSNFSDETILGERGAGKVYKGQLLSSGQLIDIVARRLEGQAAEFELWREVSMLSSYKHQNLALVSGFCDENGEKIIIYKHSINGCLDKLLGNATLTWSEKMKICLGVAKALHHLHYEDIHCGISSSKVLVDKDGEAKVFGFGLSTSYPGNWMHRLLISNCNDTSADKNFVRWTPKYDVYSYGLLLCDVLCAGKPWSTHNGTLSEKLDEMIHPDLRKQMSTQSLTNLKTLAANCLSPEYVNRPSMDEIVSQLENMLKLQPKQKDDEHSTLAEETTRSKRLTNKNKERLKIPLSHIIDATGNFSDDSLLGHGAYGQVYRGKLDHLDIKNIPDWMNKEELPKKCSTVAIKRISDQQAGEEGFLAELEILARCNHRNVVSLLGFCREDVEMILVFEFASKGSLDECLEKNKMANVTWPQRIQLCLDVAEGLNYIHTSLEGGGRVVHRDIKSANILLDENWNAKIADFGLSKLHSLDHQASTIRTMRGAGTPCYIDPEFSFSNNTFKKESDIYAFGVVLFEILSGRLAYDRTYIMENDTGLAFVARRRFNDKTIKELIDPNMMEEANEHIFTVNKEPNQKSLDVFTEIAYKCLEDTKVKRPKMEEIIKDLKDALKFQGGSVDLVGWTEEIV